MANLPAPAVKVPPVARKHHGWPLAVAAIFCLFIIVGGGLAYYVIRGMFGFADKAANMPERIGQSLAESFSPQTTYITKINSAIGEIKHTPKLVVNTYEIDVEIQKTASSSWGYLYWGTTDVSVRAHRNKIQYFVPVEGLGTGNFSWDANTKVLHATVPLPRLDEEMVEVQSDPAKIDVRTDLGWAQSDRGTGQTLRDAAKRELRAAIIQAGKGEAQQALAEKDARAHFVRLLEPVAQSMAPGAKVEVDFENPAK